jgi:hypothetical protein
MRGWARSFALATALGVVGTGATLAHDPARRGQRWWRGERKEAFRNGPCEVKIESKRGEFKRDIECPDGRGADWQWPLEREYRDGGCLVKDEAKRDQYEEEVKCDD